MSNDEARIRLLCGLLVSDDDALGQAVELDEDAWTQLLMLANHLWLGSTLAHQLFETPFWHQLDSELQSYLSSLRQFSSERNQQLAQCTESIQTIFEQNGIDAVWIKGASALFNGIDSPVGRRWMMDLDLLVADGQIDDAIDVLLKHEFKGTPELKQTGWRKKCHAPELKSPDGKFFVELHFRIVTPACLITGNQLSTLEIFTNKVELRVGEHLGWQPSAEDQVVHALIHDQVSHEHYSNNVINLRYLLNFCWLVEHCNHELNWSNISSRINDLKLLEVVLFLCWKLFQVETSMTEKNSVEGERYWQSALTNQLNSSLSLNKTSRVDRFVYSFSRQGIFDQYGSDRGLPLFLARVRNVARLLRLRMHSNPLENEEETRKKRTAKGLMWSVNKE